MSTCFECRWRLVVLHACVLFGCRGAPPRKGAACMEQAGPPLALDRDACGVAEVAVRSGRGSASVSRATLGYEVQRARHRGASVTLHSGVEVRAACRGILPPAAGQACAMLTG